MKTIKTVFIFLFLIVVIKSAWISNDAWHGFRIVDNFVQGYGLRYNEIERVQVQSSNLWLFVMIIPYYITNEAYYTFTLISIFLSLVSFILLLYCLPAQNKYSIIIAGAVLCMSKAFVDYSTSGLENPLTHLLIIVFFMSLFKEKLLWTNILAVLLLINRLDVIIVIALPLIVLNWKYRKRFIEYMLIWLGYLGWGLFLIYYYGFFFPNSYYLKLFSGIDSYELFKQGLLYFMDSCDADPITLMFVGTGVALAFISRNKYLITSASGIMLYLIYVTKFGGCFMSGRFFVLPLLVSIIIILKTSMVRETFFVFIGLILFIGIISNSPLKAHANSTGPIGASGIADERGGTYWKTGLLKSIREQKMPIDPWAYKVNKEWREKIKTGDNVLTGVMEGFDGFLYPKELYILSDDALADPLRARIPALAAHKPFKWRVGHYIRPKVHGQKESIFGENVISDPDLKNYYGYLKYITRGPLFDLTRIKLIYELNVGEHDYLLDNWKKKNGY